MASTLNKIISHKAVWHLIDARGQLVGRLANQIAPILRGKHKPTFCANEDCGDFVVVINAKDVEFSGKKWAGKIYKYHSGFPGGLKERPADWQLNRKPEEILRKAVMGMLPKNELRRRMTAKLRIYPGPCHLHEDQLPPDTAECLLVEQKRTFNDEVVEEVDELSPEEQAEWDKFKAEAYAWQIEKFGKVLGGTEEENEAKEREEEELEKKKALAARAKAKESRGPARKNP